MCHLLVIFALILVSATAAVSGVSRMMTSFDVKPLAADDAAQCNGVAAGARVCSSDCTGVLLCRGSADPVQLETCSENQACYYGECIEGTSSCELENTPMQCTARGIFPDPYNCTNYHVCEDEGDSAPAVACRDGWAFDSTSALCSKQPDDTTCEALPISCDALGDTDIFPGNPNIYYFCVSDLEGGIHPTLYKCPHGGTYDPVILLCTDDTSSGTESIKF